MNYPKKTVIYAALFFVLVAVGYFLMTRESSNVSSPNSLPTTADGVNLAPPTEEEKQAGDLQKEENIKKEEARNNPGLDPSDATVVITDAGVYDGIVEVRSFIPDHYEDGTCTIEFTKGSNMVTKTAPAYRDVSTTICTNPVFSVSELGNGSWQVTVRYNSESNKTAGISDPVTFNTSETL